VSVSCTSFLMPRDAGKVSTINENVSKKRKRFDGVPESEVLLMTLPDLILPNLDLLVVGINPGVEAAYRKHYYDGPGNHFWQCMNMAGILPSGFMTAEDDASLLDMGIGFTNVVDRTTRGQADLSKEELMAGCVKLREKIETFKPKIVVFNGKYIFELFSGTRQLSFGLQPGVIAEGVETFQYVMPSSSARCSQLPRAVDKLPFFKGIKKMLDLVRGKVDKVEEGEVTFKDLKLKTAKKK